MNKRIRELEKQSGLEIYGLGKDRAKWQAAVEKFAELIIREYSYDVMNLHGAQPERIEYAAKCWEVEL